MWRYAPFRRGCGGSAHPRSAAKPFIAAAAIEAGLAERFHLDGREVAVMCGSHAGEPFHVDAVRSILRKAGLDEDALQCGADLPYNARALHDVLASGGEPAAIYHNCSGKHAGILALCVLLGCDVHGYMEPESPVQKRILDFCASMSGLPSAELHLGVDGCGIPAYATTLRRVAVAYLRLATLEGVDEPSAAALRIVREAMLAFPEYVSGTGEFDASLSRAGGGTLACKGGAEGIHATALIDRRAAHVLKVLDGNERARPAAAIEGLTAIGALDGSRRAGLERFIHTPVRNRAGREVGTIRTLERLSLQ